MRMGCYKSGYSEFTVCLTGESFSIMQQDNIVDSERIELSMRSFYKETDSTVLKNDCDVNLLQTDCRGSGILYTYPDKGWKAKYVSADALCVKHDDGYFILFLTWEELLAERKNSGKMKNRA